MKTASIFIARDFSPSPAGRYVGDGPFPGQTFREQWLQPAVEQNDEVEVILDGTDGYGSSFLEEAFGGLVRAGISALTLHRKLKLISSRKSYEARVWTYIDRAAGA
jgi:hypothetical protein